MLPSAIRKRIEDEAVKRGADPAEAVAEAERLSASSGGKDGGGSDEAPARPLAERLLIGFLPFIKVRELRSLWLGLTEPVIDDELTCAEWQLKHGSPASTSAPPEVE